MLSNRAVSCFRAILCYILFFSPHDDCIAFHVHIIFVSCIVYIFDICIPFCISQHTEITDVEWSRLMRIIAWRYATLRSVCGLHKLMNDHVYAQSKQRKDVNRTVSQLAAAVKSSFRAILRDKSGPLSLRFNFFNPAALSGPPPLGSTFPSTSSSGREDAAACAAVFGSLEGCVG
jgi:hypothetical protein